MNPVRALFLSAFAFTVLSVVPMSAQAGRFSHCEYVEDFKPNKGAVKLWTVRIKTEWEERQHCLPGGRKVPYKVKVITYRDRYTDGVQRTWKCVVAGSEVNYGK